MVECLSRLCYNRTMYNILLIGKELPDSIDFCEALKASDNKVYVSSKLEADAVKFESEDIFTSTWNKASAVSAHSFLIKAETKLEKINHVVFYYDAAYLCSKFELDKTEELSQAVDQLINSYLYTTGELLKRIDQKKEDICVSFVVRNYPSKYEIAVSGNRTPGVLPASSIVSIGEAAFTTLAQNFSTYVADREYLSVILAKCPYNNELYKNDKQLAAWLLESFDTISQAKHRQTVKQASTWNKVGTKLSTGFALFK